MESMNVLSLSMRPFGAPPESWWAFMLPGVGLGWGTVRPWSDLMAGDWIKMRSDLARDPAVIALCEIINEDRFWVVGALHTVWSWFDEQTQDGCCASVALMFVDSLVSVTGFGAAMVKVGWLEERQGGGIRIPRFDKHNGKTGKTRALARNRMQRLRDGGSATDASLEKRREEKKKYPPKPPQGGAGAFRSNGDAKPKRPRPLTPDQAVRASRGEPI